MARRPVPTAAQTRVMSHAWSRPGRHVIGIDEVGRGACADPLVVVGVLAEREWDHALARDSKKLSHKRHMEGYDAFISQGKAGDGIVAVLLAAYEPEEVDVLGLDAANRDLTLRIAQALYALQPSPIMLDGDLLPFIEGIPPEDLFNMPSSDALVASSGAASVIAKAHRDTEMMENLHPVFPQYGWYFNKGYLTMGHAQAIQQYGVCPVHRYSYQRIKESLVDSSLWLSRQKRTVTRAWMRYLRR